MYSLAVAFHERYIIGIGNWPWKGVVVVTCETVWEYLLTKGKVARFCFEIDCNLASYYLHEVSFKKCRHFWTSSPLEIQK